MKSLGNSSKKVQNIVVVGLFAAICYVAIMLFRIPYPAPVGNPFIHFGNLFVILCALLFGGWQGGLAGAIGMGLYDVMTGYGWATAKTVILKFGIGIVAGIIAYYGKKHPDKNARGALIVSSLVSLLIGVALLLAKMYLESFSDIAPISYIFMFLLTAVTLGVALFEKNLSASSMFALLGACGGIAFNVVGEFAGGVIIKVLSGSDVGAAAVASIISLPATFINGVFSIIGAVLQFVPLNKALVKMGFEA